MASRGGSQWLAQTICSFALTDLKLSLASRSQLEECEVTIITTRLEILEIEKQAEADDRLRSFEIEEYRTKVQRLMDLGKVAKRIYDELRDKIMKKDKVVDARKALLAEKEDLLIVLDEERCRLDFDLLDLQRRQERQKALLSWFKRF
ncbi:hypothetical protein N431DRAFT_425749 [Stipitochalara longipes BDJ]|nr:hypothetical protein N431DRAFT_425749 [Stipitochalara longipes BDJ]